MYRWLFFVLLLLPIATLATGATVLLEAESFQEYGGWVLDQQSMDQMGSPYLMAHGMGRPVTAASTAVTFPEKGAYRVWVRTRNWLAPWNPQAAPGRFRIAINGDMLRATLGTTGENWHWQDAGEVAIEKLQCALTLHDLTGFNGRCDAILFSSETGFVPPEEKEALRTFREKHTADSLCTPITHSFDFVVVGGGMAGTCAAISAARLGLSVALIQDRPVLGGNNSSEVRVHLQGKINLPPYPALGDLVKELDSGFSGNAHPASYYNDTRKLGVAKAEKNLHLFLNTRANAVEMTDGKIAAVLAQRTNSGQKLRFLAPLFADCTGDGVLGFLAGADYRMGRESRDETGESLAPEKADAMTMGASVQWYATRLQGKAAFPDCPWAISFTESTCQKTVWGEWDWETGMDRNQVTETERVRDHALRVIYGNWSFLKNHNKYRLRYAPYHLEWVAYIAGKRESRRLLGDVILREQDIVEAHAFPDACVTTTWTIDLHYPEPQNSKDFPGEEFRSIAKHKRIEPYPIPYRCLYSRNIPNLFMAGRDISVTHVALGTVRVMRTCGMMGEVVGMAASLCHQQQCEPRTIYDNHLQALQTLMSQGVGKAFFE